ncbi:MAG: hypothetical protein WCA35_14885 [Kovacikia sp.]
MRFFIDSKSNNHGQPDRVKYRTTQHYVELEIPSESYLMVLYLVPRDRDSAFVVTCWDSVFDQDPANLNDEKSCKAIFETCPNLAHRLTNGIYDRYHEGALLKLEDFDTGKSKWFLAAVVDNLDFMSLDTLLNEQAHQVIGQIMHQSFELLNELYEKQPPVFDTVAKRIGKGLSFGLAVGAAAVLSNH